MELIFCDNKLSRNFHKQRLHAKILRGGSALHVLLATVKYAGVTVLDKVLSPPRMEFQRKSVSSTAEERSREKRSD